jgi:hypothetical protein
VTRACRSNPLGYTQELRLDFLGILVDLLRVYLLADPRSFQERLAVGSVVEAGEHRRHDLDENRLHIPSPAAGVAGGWSTRFPRRPKRAQMPGGVTHPGRMGTRGRGTQSAGSRRTPRMPQRAPE